MSGCGEYGNLFLFFGIIQGNGVPGAGLDNPFIDIFIISCIFTGHRRLVFTVPECPQDIGFIEIIMLKGNQYLVIHLGDKLKASVGAGHQVNQPCPVALQCIRYCGIIHFYPGQVFGVFGIGDNTHDHTVPARTIIAR